MTAEPPEWIREVLSTPRFAPYLANSDGDVEAAIRLYWWNVEISAAFYTPLHCLELGLRNAVHDRLRIWFGRVDWWASAPLSDNGRRIVASAVRKVGERVGRSYTANDIVAELSFGFWVSLVSRGASYDRTLWVPALHRAFPYYQGGRKPLHDNLFAMVLLRNRIMHHEPIHHRHLHADHAKIYRLLGYLSPSMAKELEMLDRVSEVLQRRGEDLRRSHG
ncbi:hypothetical protein [Phytoactinopolyspora endophytica]|uniref:hypothetical protein n=1 Tax=Phytoactinopolyspora endophytica TaxID=1642495 RepID=UPI00101D8A57|nr:hypothetical protein [Phytoactinopolyspora endophytica]